MQPLRVAIVGAGRMGQIRARSAGVHPQCQLTHVVDVDRMRAQALASQAGCAWSDDWEKVVGLAELDAVVVSTPHKFLAPIAYAALTAGKHVFCEKPMAGSAAEGQSLVEALAKQTGATDQRKLMVGFTLRQHPAIARARQLLAAGAIGQPFYIRGFYGHGGRPGYEREWRLDRRLGGGELLDQGVHLIDLSRWFLGDFAEVTGMIGSYYWAGMAETDAPVKSCFACAPEGDAEDNGFLLLRTPSGQTASLHASWTQWKNAFQFEIYGREGSLAICGLGGSYGPEKLVQTRRNPAGGVPQVIERNFTYTASVWQREWQTFVAAIRPDLAPAGECSQAADAVDGWQALRIVEKVYHCAAGPARLSAAQAGFEVTDRGEPRCPGVMQ